MGLAGEAADRRVSIAGTQEKTALLQMDGRWYLPRVAKLAMAVRTQSAH